MKDRVVETIAIGDIYVHHRNKKEYKVTEFIPLKVNGQWTKGVIYTSMEDGNVYSRPIADFKEKFSLANSEIKRRVFNTIADLVADFLYYDRKEDEDLPKEAIENAIKAGSITATEIVDQFEKELLKSIL